MGTSVTHAELKIMCQLTPTKKSAQAIYTGVFQSPFFFFSVKGRAYALKGSVSN